MYVNKAYCSINFIQDLYFPVDPSYYFTTVETPCVMIDEFSFVICGPKFAISGAISSITTLTSGH
jgi:hypothetical protein